MFDAIERYIIYGKPILIIIIWFYSTHNYVSYNIIQKAKVFQRQTTMFMGNSV